MNFKEMKAAIKPLLKQYYGISGSQADEMIFESDEIDDGIMSEVMCGLDEEISVGMDIEGLKVEDKKFSYHLSPIEGNQYLAILWFGSCTDAEEAKKAMYRYDISDFSEILCIENVVEDEGDIFALSKVFEAKNNEELYAELEEIFNTLQDSECRGLLKNILEYFEV